MGRGLQLGPSCVEKNQSKHHVATKTPAAASCRPTQGDRSPKPRAQKQLDVHSPVQSKLVTTVLGGAVVENIGPLSRQATQAAGFERPPPPKQQPHQLFQRQQQPGGCPKGTTKEAWWKLSKRRTTVANRSSTNKKPVAKSTTITSPTTEPNRTDGRPLPR